jgi:DNA-binding IscR family transcriptional regulator
MTILEGPIEIADCIDGVECESSDCCATKAVWEKIKNSIDSVMNSITLQDIMDDYKAIKDKKSGIKITDRSE